MTQFRRDQSRALIVSLLRTLAPRMAGKGTLRAVVAEVHRDGLLWLELEHARAVSFPETSGGLDDRPASDRNPSHRNAVAPCQQFTRSPDGART